MTLSASTRTTLWEYWSDRLGIPSEAITQSGVTIGTTSDDGVHLLRFDESLVISVPPPLPSPSEHQAQRLERLDISNRAEILEWFDAFDRIETVHGPVFWGYTDQEAITTVDSDARALRVADEAAFDTLRRSVPEDDWEHGGSSFDPGETVGRFVEDKLVAVAGYEVWDELIAHVAVVTHPEYRGKGYGREVVSKATEIALDRGFIPQYRTLDAWPWSVAVAQSVGYTRVATGYFGVITE